jgi:hypothetical protein
MSASVALTKRDAASGASPSSHEATVCDSTVCDSDWDPFWSVASATSSVRGWARRKLLQNEDWLDNVRGGAVRRRRQNLRRCRASTAAFAAQRVEPRRRRVRDLRQGRPRRRRSRRRRRPSAPRHEGGGRQHVKAAGLVEPHVGGDRAGPQVRDGAVGVREPSRAAVGIVRVVVVDRRNRGTLPPTALSVS